jgi:hypothetical protein
MHPRLLRVICLPLHRRAGFCEKKNVVIFGYTEEQLAEFFLTYGVGAFIAFMVFIIWRLARDSKAGKFGTFVIFLGLGVGFVGYLAKIIIQWWMER